MGKHLEKTAQAATFVAGLLIIALMVAQVVIVALRYIFALGLSWTQDLMVYLFMLASVLPLVIVVYQNHNVRVDVFFQSYSPATKSRLDRFALFALLLPVCAFTVWVSAPSVINSWQLLEGSPTFGGLPGYFLLKTVQLVMFAGLSLCAIVLILRPVPWAYDLTSDQKDP